MVCLVRENASLRLFPFQEMKVASLSSIVLILSVLTVNSFDDFLVPSSEDVFETRK